MSGLHNKAGKFCKLIIGWSLSIGWSLIIGWSILISWVIRILEACWISIRPFPIFCPPLARWGGQPFHFRLYLPIGPPKKKDREARRGCYMLLSLSLSIVGAGESCLWWFKLQCSSGTVLDQHRGVPLQEGLRSEHGVILQPQKGVGILIRSVPLWSLCCPIFEVLPASSNSWIYSPWHCLSNISNCWGGCLHKMQFTSGWSRKWANELQTVCWSRLQILSSYWHIVQ